MQSNNRLDYAWLKFVYFELVSQHSTKLFTKTKASVTNASWLFSVNRLVMRRTFGRQSETLPILISAAID